MAVYRALTVQSGQTKQIQDGTNFLAVGAGLDMPSAGTLVIGEQYSTTVTIGSHANTTAINIGSIAAIKTITIGSGITGGGQTTLNLNANVHVYGTETVDGGTTFNDNVTFGNATTDWVAFVARVGPIANPNLHFVQEIDHTIDIDASTTTGTVGGALTVKSAAGSPADVTNPGGAGGAYTASAGTGGVADANNDGGGGGHGTVSAGAGGAGTLTNLAGVGGNLLVLGGAAGKANGAGSTLGNNGGSVTVRGGEGKGTGQIGGAAYLDGGPCGGSTGGAVYVGDTNAPTVAIGRTLGTSVTLNSGQIVMQEAGATLMTLDAGYIQPNCDIRFTNNTKRAMSVAASAVTVPGQELSVVAGAGGNASGGVNAGAGGLSKMVGGLGGDAGPNANEGSAVGGDVQITGGVGGKGDATIPAEPAQGGTITIAGGAGGPLNGGTYANGGDVVVNAGVKTGAGDDGVVLIGTTAARQVTVGNASGTFRSQAGGNSFVNDISFDGNLGTTQISFNKATGVGDALEIKSQQGASGSGSGDLHLYAAGSDTQSGSVLVAGGKGTGSCDGGSVSVDAGIATGSGVSGDVSIGTGVATTVTVGNNTSTTMLNGASIAFMEAGTTELTLDGGNLTFSNTAAIRYFGIEPSPLTVAGKGLSVVAGAGGDADSLTQGGVGGNYGTIAGMGGSADAGAGELSAAGGKNMMYGGIGGAGHATGSKAASDGGDSEVWGGLAGAVNGGTGANGGRVLISGGIETGNGSSGSVVITTPTPGGIGNPGSVSIQTSATDRLVFSGNSITVQPGTVLNCAGTGAIDLSTDNTVPGAVFFRIDNVPVGATGGTAITALNFDKLFDGSVVTTHTHSGLSGSSLDVAGLDTTTKSVTTGLFGFQDSTANEMDLTDADAPAKSFCFGGNTGTAGTMRIAGVVAAAKFNTDDLTPVNGAPVFLSPATKDTGTAAGKLTSKAPSTVGQSVAQVGICMDASNYAALKTCKILLQITTKIDL